MAIETSAMAAVIAAVHRGSACHVVAVGSALRSCSQNAVAVARTPRRSGLYASHEETRTPRMR